MADKNTLSSLIAQVSIILDIVQKEGQKIEASPEVYEALNRLEEGMERFLQLNQKALQESHIDIEKAQRANTMTPKEKNLLERAKTIERHARALQLRLSKKLEQGSATPTRKGDVEQKKMKERQKRFKRLGGDGWLRL